MKDALMDEMSNMVDALLDNTLAETISLVASMTKRGIEEKDTLEVVSSATRIYLLHLLSNHMKLTDMLHICAVSGINDTHIEVKLTLLDTKQPPNKELH